VGVNESAGRAGSQDVTADGSPVLKVQGQQTKAITALVRLEVRLMVRQS